MDVVKKIAGWADQSWAWTLLFLSALGLELTALYFQYGLELRPCIMCIYQRCAVFGLIFAGLLPMLKNNGLTRFLAFVIWGISAVWGYLIAREHMDIIDAADPFFACEFVPNFPSWMPLHEWIPSVFAATGGCGDIDWMFMGLNMPEWMAIIFAVYSILFAVVLASRLIVKKQF